MLVWCTRKGATTRDLKDEKRVTQALRAIAEDAGVDFAVFKGDPALEARALFRRAVAVVGVFFPGGEQSGLAMAGGSAYRCRFGAPDAPVAPLDVHGTHTSAPQGDLVHCVSPLLLPNRTLAGVLPPLSPYPLFVSLNAQQYTPAVELATFSFLEPPLLPLTVRPLEGRQETPITIFGAGYDNGCDYRCRFGILGTVAASYDMARGAIRCAVPSPAAVGVPLELASTSLNSSAALPVAVSLNVQQYHGIRTHEPKKIRGRISRPKRENTIFLKMK